MHREYHRWWSNDLQRDMELLCFGHAGTQDLGLPYFRWDAFLSTKTTRWLPPWPTGWRTAQLQIYCVDSVDGESWYNKRAHPYWRVQRHLQYERYIINDVLPLMWNKNWTPRTIVTGCSFGAYHAVNFAFRHPEWSPAASPWAARSTSRASSMAGTARMCTSTIRPTTLANCTDGWKYNHIRTVLATGEWDMCWEKNEKFAAILRARGIRHELYVWGDRSYHDWPWWRPMARMYL